MSLIWISSSAIYFFVSDVLLAHIPDRHIILYHRGSLEFEHPCSLAVSYLPQNSSETEVCQRKPFHPQKAWVNLSVCIFCLYISCRFLFHLRQSNIKFFSVCRALRLQQPHIARSCFFNAIQISCCDDVLRFQLEITTSQVFACFVLS